MIRKYIDNPDVEIVNSRPISRPKARVSFDVTPHGSLVTFATSFASYSWDDVAPNMYYHPAGTVLTFTATLATDTLGFNIVEWYWDFGDDMTALGQVVTHTYKVAGPSTIAHLRATDEDGIRSYASMNLMLTS